MPARRWALAASCVRALGAGTLIAFSVAPATIPVSRSPMRDWKCLTAARERRRPRSALGAAGVGAVEIALDREALAQFDDRIGPLAAGPSGAMSVGQPPAAAIAA